MKLQYWGVAAVFAAMPALAQQRYLRGVNISGAEWGSNTLPGQLGREYTFSSEKTYQYFAAKGLGLVRLPILWERIQPVARGPLDPDYLALVKRSAAWANASGGQVFIEIHNFARYRGVVTNEADLADLWARLSQEFQGNTGVWAYDLMNEPHDMGSANWKAISQAAVTAIRGRGDNTLILVPGNGWSGAGTWVQNNGATSWIQDPANNFMYEAHTYFDSDNSGTYVRSYDEELARDPNLPDRGPARLKVFVDWCRQNNVPGFLGEFGLPWGDVRWMTVLERFLAALDDAGMGGAYWAAGDWWENYIIGIQPLSGYTVDRPQMPILQRHLAPGYLINVSAASFAGWIFAPGSWVTSFGSRLEGDLELTDSAGQAFRVMPSYASATQINYLVPEEAALGRITAVVQREGKTTGQGVFWLERVAPALFTATFDGQGVPAGQLLRIKADGTRAFETLAQPIEFLEAGERLFLILYGTGIRRASSTLLSLGKETASITFAGAQGEYAGLDQVNAEVPRTAAGSGKVDVVLLADNKAANTVTLEFQ